MDGKTITLDNMNANLIAMEYAVRGPIVIRAGEIERDLKAVRLLPFTRTTVGSYPTAFQPPPKLDKM